MQYNEQFITELMQKYNTTIEQLEYVITKIYTEVIRETYNNDKLIVKMNNGNIEIYNENNQLLEAPNPTAAMAHTLKKALIYELTNIQQLNEYKEFVNRVGELFQVKITNIIDNKLVVSVNGKYSGEITLPANSNMRNYRIGSYSYALLDKVYNNSYNSNTDKKYGRQLVFETLSNNYIYSLIKHFIPYISNNIVTVENIVRIPMKRTKIVVSSEDRNINAASICIGKNGEIAKKLYEALNGEYIDFINEAYDLESKIKSYCKPFHVLLIKTMTDNSIKIVIDDRHEHNLHVLTNKTNLILLNKLLFSGNTKMFLVFRTMSEYKLEISEIQQQLYSLLISEGINNEIAETLVNKFIELNDLIFVTNVNMPEQDTIILHNITQNRKHSLKEQFVKDGGEANFFEYCTTRFTREEFMRLQLSDIKSFETILSYNAVEIAQIMNVDISFATTIQQEIKSLN